MGVSLSLRRLIAILRRHATYNSDESVYEAVQRATLARFLPAATRASLEATLAKAGISPNVAAKRSTMDGDNLREQLPNISRSAPLTSLAESKIPEVVFYDNEQVNKQLAESRSYVLTIF